MLKNIRIGKRLIILFIIVAIVSNIATLVSSIAIGKINADAEMALNNYGFATGNIASALVTVADSRRAVRDAVNFDDSAKRSEAKRELYDVIVPKYEKYFAEIEGTIVNDEEQKLYDQIKNTVGIYDSKRDELISAGENTSDEQRRVLSQRMNDELDPAYQDLYDEFADLLNLKKAEGHDLTEKLGSLGQKALGLSIGMGFLSIALAVILGTFIARSIAKPIGQCTDRIQLLAEGDLHSPIPEITSKDEVGVLADATTKIVEMLTAVINETGRGLAALAAGDLTPESSMVYPGELAQLKVSMERIFINLNATMGQINQSADQVSSGSGQVSAAAQALSQGATEQASSVEELSATINDISNNIKQNADNAIAANGLASRAGEALQFGSRQVADMVKAMTEIYETTGRIGKIIKTIDDIAFQTNILALNAAVEAARAGEAGKGFAVVADEVRNLAQKSAEAAKDTTELIENTVNAVDNGRKIANGTAKSIALAVEKAEEVVGKLDKITSASVEQSDAIVQVTQGVEQISAVVQTNSATAEESAASSEELSGQAQLMKELVGKFKIKGMESNGYKIHKEYNDFSEHNDISYNDSSYNDTLYNEFADISGAKY